MVQKYRKKPATVEAIRFVDNSLEGAETIVRWIKDNNGHAWAGCGTKNAQPIFYVRFSTCNGSFNVYPGDWVIKDECGVFYNCLNSTFEQTYEAVRKSSWELQ